MGNIEPLDSQSVNLQDTIKMVAFDYRNTIKHETELQQCITNLNTFYQKNNEEFIKRTTLTMPPYQYLPENQDFWQKNVMAIARQASATYKLILETYKELFRLETNQLPPPPQLGMNQNSQPSVNVYAGANDKRSLLPSLGLFKPKTEHTITPFKLEIEPIKARQILIQKFYDYIDFHNFKCGWPEFIEPAGMYDFLQIEKTEFFNRIGPVVTIISEGYELKRESTKHLGTQLAMGSLLLGEKHRDFTQQ